MYEIGISDCGVNADGCAETCEASDENSLPQAPRRSPTPDAEEHSNAATADTAAKAGAIMRYERHKTSIELVELVGRDSHKFEILGYKDAADANSHDDEAAESKADCRDKEEGSTGPIGGSPVDGKCGDEKALGCKGDAESKVRPDEADDEARKQRERYDAMPRVEIAVSKIEEKAAETEDAAKEEEPPRPGVTGPEGELGDPGIESADRDERPSKGHAIVDHEVREFAISDLAELLWAHSEEREIVR